MGSHALEAPSRCTRRIEMASISIKINRLNANTPHRAWLAAAGGNRWAADSSVFGRLWRPADESTLLRRTCGAGASPSATGNIPTPTKCWVAPRHAACCHAAHGVVLLQQLYGQRSGLVRPDGARAPCV